MNFASSQDANLLVIGLGRSLQIVPDNLDGGFNTVGNSQIATNPLTAGVSSFTYGLVSGVSGGTSLFTTTGGQTFIADAVAAARVPEPATVALFGAGLIGLGLMLRRRRAKGKAASSVDARRTKKPGGIGSQEPP